MAETLGESRVGLGCIPMAPSGGAGKVAPLTTGHDGVIPMVVNDEFDIDPCAENASLRRRVLLLEDAMERGRARNKLLLEALEGVQNIVNDIDPWTVEAP